MPKVNKLTTELQDLKHYITSPLTEASKRQYAYPFFRKCFPKTFNTESEGADIYIEGRVVVELKTSQDQWLAGLFQAMHYSKKGLTFSHVSVIAESFIGLWSIANLPPKVKEIADKTDPMKAASEVGPINAAKIEKTLRAEIAKSAIKLIKIGDIPFDEIDADLFEYSKAIKHLEMNRLLITRRDFIHTIEYFKKFFDNPIDAVHCFYGIVGQWTYNSKAYRKDGHDDTFVVAGVSTNRVSEDIHVNSAHMDKILEYINSHYIFTNEGSGISADYYFSRFDEVLSNIMPEYTKQHGIYFTDINLSKFALWFIHNKIEKHLSDKYVVIDPAAGSGNLITSWKGRLKHKILSELQPDLLKTLERRMKLSVAEDFELAQAGFTIVPKPSDNEGLNFLDCTAAEYMHKIENRLKETGHILDKPLAFLMNPPYKNTDENENKRKRTESDYAIDKSISALLGGDAEKERYAAFLAQILNIAKWQNEKNENLKPMVMIFTPTSWLFPRPAFAAFRSEFDKYFKYSNGFIINGKEFFKKVGNFPIAFTIWQYDYNENGNHNIIKLNDYCSIKSKDIDINWNDTDDSINIQLKKVLQDTKKVTLDNSRKDIRSLLPFINKRRQPRYDFSIKKTEKDYNKIVSGFPAKDIERHYNLLRICGTTNGLYVGFMDDLSPCRLKMDNYRRMSNKPDRLWFRDDEAIQNIRQSQIFSGPADNRSYCAYDLESAKATIMWFCINKAIVSRYPICFNKFNIWCPNITIETEDYFYALCFAYAFAENRCVVTTFEKDNPVKDAPEIYVDNPMSPMNTDSFWSTTLKPHIKPVHGIAYELVDAINQLYTTFVYKYCQNKIENVGLKNEPYFKYFSYPDYLTKDSGLVQIRKFAEIQCHTDLLELISDIKIKAQQVNNEIYRLLVDEYKYFD